MLAEYPQLLVSDVVSDGQPKSQLWRHLSLVEINRQLADVLSSYEDGLNSTRELLTTEGVLEGLAANLCDLGAGALGEAPTRVTFELRNNGALPVEWSAALRNDVRVDVDVENWVDEGEAPTDRDRLERYLIESGLLDVRPRGGQLAPGQTAQLAVTYQHEVLGTHVVPLLLAVKHGKRVRMDLLARTLPADLPLLVLPAAESVLRPVAIGDTEPPLQAVELRNGGPAPLRYRLDPAPFAALKAESYDFAVLSCTNPEGTIPPYGTVLLNFLFQPLEAREYSASIPVAVEGSDGAELVLRGRGFHPLEAGTEQPSAAEAADASDFAPVAPRPTLALQWQLGEVSPEVLHLRDVPALSVSRRLVLVTNRSTGPVDFSWDVGLAATDMVESSLRFEPPSGRLEAGASALVKAVISAGARPQIFAVNACCTFTSVEPPKLPSPSGRGVRFGTGEAGGEAAEKPAGEILAAHGTTFGRPVGLLSETSRVRDMAEAEPSAELLRTLNDSGSFVPHAPRRGVAEAMTKSLRNQKPRLQELHERTVRRMVESLAVERRVEPVLPTACFLRITARVHSQASFRASFGQDAYGAFWVPLANKAAPPPGAPQPGALPSLFKDEPAAVAEEIITRALLEAILDPAIEKAFEGIPEEEVPYFVQLRAPAGSPAAENSESASERLGGDPDAAFAEVAEASAVARAMNAAAAAPPAAEDSGSTAAGGAAAASLRAEAEAAEAEARVLARPEVAELLEAVLEGTLFNLMRESLDPAAEWDVTGGRSLSA